MTCFWKTACLPLVFFVSTGMINAIRTEVPGQTIYGLATVRFGIPPNRVSCSGVIYKGWIITAGHCYNSADIEASMYNRGSVLHVTNNSANVVQLGSGISSLTMIRLPGAFVDRGDHVAPKTILSTTMYANLAAGRLQCFGRGDDVDSPDGDPSKSSDGPRGNDYRSGEFTVDPSSAGYSINIDYGQFGEKPARGDSGGPCFFESPTGDPYTQTVVGLITEGLFYYDKKKKRYDYIYEELTPIAPFASEIESIINGAPPPPPPKPPSNGASMAEFRIITKLPNGMKIPKQPHH